ncbi:MAG: glycerol-3-phosphate responsive antiterminator [Oscillospiraceae bacterium]|nr:glycerol-3-phosphate responsive antiterminator [Oscillospiraceae bacterium]
MRDTFERSPIIAAVHDNQWNSALKSEAEVLFLLKSNVLNLSEQIAQAHTQKKRVFVHIDLADGIGKDEAGVEFIASCGADGIISTRGALIRFANGMGLCTVQRCFILDSQGIQNSLHVLESSKPDFIEILPGVVDKVTRRFAERGFPTIAGGLIERKQEVTAALSSGAIAVSTGCEALWNLA